MSIVIGLDPGANTGVAVFENGKLARLETIAPMNIESLLTRDWAGEMASRVIFEDSRLQSHVWTTSTSRAAALKMARNLGQVDAWCSLIAHTCAAMGIDCHSISPKGKGKKLDAKQFKAATGWDKPSNQHGRDSAMVAWPYRRAGK